MLRVLTNQALREQKILRWASVGLPIFITAFVWAPSRDGLEGVYALSFFIPILLLLPWRKPQMAQYGGHFTLLGLLYGGFAALTNLWSSHPDGILFLMQWIVLATWLCGISWVAACGRLNLPHLLQILLWVGATVSVLNLAWFYSNHNWDVRLEGITVNRNANNIGSVFGILSLLAYIHWLKARGRTQNFIALGLWLVIGLSLLASQSRSNFLAFVLLAPIACYWAKPETAKLWLQAGLILLLSLLVFIFADHLIPILFERGVSLRNYIWAEIWQRIYNGAWLFGTGLIQEERIIVADIGTFNHAHNAWLDSWYRTGLVGLTLNLTYLGYIYRNIFKQPELFPLYLWLSYGCIYCFVDSRGLFWQIDPKWFGIWIPTGLIAAQLNYIQTNSLAHAPSQEYSR